MPLRKFSIMLKIFIIVQLLFLCGKAEFVTTINPDCGDLCSDGTLLAYSRLQRANDSMHVLLTVGEGLGDLSLSIIESSQPKQQLNISWEELLSNSSSERRNAVKFAYPDGTVQSTISMTLSKLIEYADVGDVVDPSAQNNASYFKIYSLSDFQWQLSSSQLEGDAYQFTVWTNELIDGNSSDVFDKNGVLSVSLFLSAVQNRGSMLPRLEFTDKNSQLEIQMIGLKSHFDNSRFAIESALLSTDATDEQFKSIANIDDEYTPGIFHINNWLAIDDKQNSIGYAQWKPVCYKQPKRSIANSTVVNSGALLSLTEDLKFSLNNSFPYSLFGDVDDVRAAKAINISFGQSKDKYYKYTSYISWTLSVGIGEAPSDKVSPLAVIVIACGLGIPVLLMVAAGIYLCSRRLRAAPQESSGYQPINA